MPSMVDADVQPDIKSMILNSGLWVWIVRRDNCRTVQIVIKMYRYIGICRDFCNWRWCVSGRLITFRNLYIFLYIYIYHVIWHSNVCGELSILTWTKRENGAHFSSFCLYLYKMLNKLYTSWLATHRYTIIYTIIFHCMFYIAK